MSGAATAVKPDDGAPPRPLSVRAALAGRHVFLLGGTGFVGKVLLAMLLDRFPEIGRVYVMVRRGTGTDSEARFWNNVVPSPARRTRTSLRCSAGSARNR